MRIIIGLGSGRCGTKSLAHLINEQPFSVCFHEINPACMKWSGTTRTVLSTIEEFRSILAGGPREVTIDYSSPGRDRELPRLRALESVRTIGDVGFYYLSYVPMLAECDIDIRMPCMRRDKASTVESYVKKLEIVRNKRRILGDLLSRLIGAKPYYRSKNHWVHHNGGKWQRDPKWDKCYPKFDLKSLREAVEKYWDEYYKTADILSKKYPDKVKIFDVDDLNTNEGQNEILKFCGFEGETVNAEFHVNMSA